MLRHTPMPSPLPPRDPEAFELHPAGPTLGTAVLLHGFTGTPYEVRPLADVLCAHGMHCVAPLLPGHGRVVSLLAQITAARLLDAAQDTLLTSSARGPVTLVGLSTGALIAAALAAAHPSHVNALILLTPALDLGPKGQLGIALARRGLGLLVPVIPKESPGGESGDPQGQANNPTYPVIPVAGLPALGDLQRAARAALPLVMAPTQVSIGARDGTVPPGTVDVVARLLSRAAAVEQHAYPHTQHLMLLDVERDAITADVVTFLRRMGVLPRRGTSPAATSQRDA